MKKGDIIKFGNYFHNKKSPIEWLVLDVNENEALLISLHALAHESYHDERVNITWEDCTLRKWLNCNFLSIAFFEEEREKIKVSELKNEDNPMFGTRGGNNTKDRVFCLSIDEAIQYFRSDKDRQCKPADWENLVHVSDNGCCSWWLRSTGGMQKEAVCVSSEGKIYEGGNWVNGCKVNGVFSSCYIGVRPALRIIHEPTVISKFLQFFYSYFRLRKKK